MSALIDFTQIKEGELFLNTIKYQNGKMIISDKFHPYEGQVEFNLSQVPNGAPVEVRINDIPYSEKSDAFTVVREDRLLTWQFTKSNGGFDISNDFEIIIEYEHNGIANLDTGDTTPEPVIQRPIGNVDEGNYVVNFGYYDNGRIKTQTFTGDVNRVIDYEYHPEDGPFEGRVYKEIISSNGVVITREFLYDSLSGRITSIRTTTQK
jgi:hypothetical protein